MLDPCALKFPRHNWKYKLYTFMRPCELLPDDRYYILQFFPRSKAVARENMAKRYKKKWLAGMAKTEIDIRKQGVGRRLANTWIRESNPMLYGYKK